MAKLTREEIFTQAAKKLRQEFEELSTVPHRALKGHEAEQLVKSFLGNHLPKRFGIGSGFVIDPADNVSSQTDIVIYDAFNCPVYRASEDAAIFPSSNVAAVVEVKSRLNRAELESAFRKTVELKGLAKYRAPQTPFQFHQEQTLGCIFAFTSDLSLDSVAKNYHELLRQYGLPLHVDVILVLDKGIVTLAGTLPGDPTWGITIVEEVPANAEGAHLAVAVQDVGLNSLDAFLRFLLMHLTFFRGMVDHPGFWQKNSDRLLKLTYLASFTMEKDPEKREAKLREYAEQVRHQFESGGG